MVKSLGWLAVAVAMASGSSVFAQGRCSGGRPQQSQGTSLQSSPARTYQQMAQVQAYQQQQYQARMLQATQQLQAQEMQAQAQWLQLTPAQRQNAARLQVLQANRLLLLGGQ